MKLTRGGKGKAAERIPFVEGLRGVAALYVVLGHLCSMSDPSWLAGKQSQAPQWFQILISPFGFGHLAVAAFIVISGYCLQYSLFARGNGEIKSLPRYFAKRSRRILPAYYGCLFVSTMVALHVTSRMTGMPFALYLPVTTQNVWAHIFLIHNWSVDWMYKLNGVLWSIAIEFQLYIVFPLIVLSFMKLGRWWTLTLASVCALAFIAIAPDALKLYPWFLPLFVLGMVSAHLAYRPHPVWGPGAWVIRWLSYIFVALTLWAVQTDKNLPTTDCLAGAAVACFCYAGTVGKQTGLVKFLSLRPLLGLGAFSYSLYLMHHPVQQLIYLFRPAFVKGEVASFIYLVAMLPVMLLAAWLFSLIFEKPFVTRPVAVRKMNGLVPASLPLKTASASAKPQPPSAGALAKRPRLVNLFAASRP